jgi:hypothetical protein
MPACIPVALATGLRGVPQTLHNTQALRGICFFRIWAATCCRISFCRTYMYASVIADHIPDTASSRQTLPLLLFTEHPYQCFFHRAGSRFCGKNGGWGSPLAESGLVAGSSGFWGAESACQRPMLFQLAQRHNRYHLWCLCGTAQRHRTTKLFAKAGIGSQ